MKCSDVILTVHWCLSHIATLRDRIKMSH